MMFRLISIVAAVVASLVSSFCFAQEEPFPLIAPMEGVRLHHLEVDEARRRLRPKEHKESIDFLTEGDRVVVITELEAKDASKRRGYPKHYRIYAIPFPATKLDADQANKQPAWVQPQTDLLAKVVMPAKVSLVKLIHGKVFFYVSGAYEKVEKAVPPPSERRVVQNGFYVADENGVRKIALPVEFGGDDDPTWFVRYPGHDQKPVNYYRHLNGDPKTPSWTNKDNRVFILCNENAIFFSRNWMDRRTRMMSLIELNLESETLGVPATLNTTWSKRYGRKAGHLIDVDRSNLIFMEYNGPKKTRTVHFRTEGKPTNTMLPMDGNWHFDQQKKFFYFYDPMMKVRANPKVFEFKKIRVADNKVIEEIKIPNRDFHPSTYEFRGETGFVSKIIPGKHEAYFHVPLDDHFYFVSKSARKKDGGNMIVKVPMEEPERQQKIEFPWVMPKDEPGIFVDDRFVYYYNQQWIVRVRHSTGADRSSRFGTTSNKAGDK